MTPAKKPFVVSNGVLEPSVSEVSGILERGSVLFDVLEQRAAINLSNTLPAAVQPAKLKELKAEAKKDPEDTFVECLCLANAYLEVLPPDVTLRGETNAPLSNIVLQYGVHPNLASGLLDEMGAIDQTVELYTTPGCLPFKEDEYVMAMQEIVDASNTKRSTMALTPHNPVIGSIFPSTGNSIKLELDPYLPYNTPGAFYCSRHDLTPPPGNELFTKSITTHNGQVDGVYISGRSARYGPQKRGFTEKVPFVDGRYLMLPYNVVYMSNFIRSPLTTRAVFDLHNAHYMQAPLTFLNGGCTFTLGGYYRKINVPFLQWCMATGTTALRDEMVSWSVGQI